MPLIRGDTMYGHWERCLCSVLCLSWTVLWSTRGGVFSQTNAVSNSISETQKWLVFSSLPVSNTVGWLTHRKTDRAHKHCCPLSSPGISVDARFRSSTKIHKVSLNSLLNSRVALSHRVNCYDFYLWKSFCLCTVCSSEKWDFLLVDENYVLTENHFLCSHP